MYKKPTESSPKSKEGELFECTYLPSFDVQLFTPQGKLVKGTAQVVCTPSQFVFYKLIGIMSEHDMITDLQHITAERIMFEKGYLHVA